MFIFPLNFLINYFLFKFYQLAYNALLMSEVEVSDTSVFYNTQWSLQHVSSSMSITQLPHQEGKFRSGLCGVVLRGESLFRCWRLKGNSYRWSPALAPPPSPLISKAMEDTCQEFSKVSKGTVSLGGVSFGKNLHQDERLPSI